MFPALRETCSIEALPPRVNARRFDAINEQLPVLVRKSSQSCWNAASDFEAAALEVFDETDGVHSFYHIDTLGTLAAVAAFLTRTQSKRRAVYFFALPERLVQEYELLVTEGEPVENSACLPMNNAHRHVVIESDKKERLFREIQSRELFNFRVDKSAMSAMIATLQEMKCRDYSPGPCSCEAS